MLSAIVVNAEASKFIFDCIGTLESMIDECNNSLSANELDSELLYNFVIFSSDLFSEYLLFKGTYSSEIPVFTKVYFNALKTAYGIIKHGLAPKKRFDSLIHYSKDVLNLFSVYKDGLNKLVRDFKKY